MVAWQIFWQSVLRVFNNKEAALKVSLVPYVIGIAAWTYLWWPYVGLNNESMRILVATGNFPWLQVLLALIVSIPCGLWTAVSWHRYILLDEEPGWVPRLRAGRMGAYFGRGLLIWLLVAVVAVAIGFVLGIILMLIHLGTHWPMELLNLVLPLPIIAAVALVGLRLLTAIAGAALGAEGGIGGAWWATRGEWGTFALLALLLIIVEVVIGFLSSLIVNQFASSVPLTLAWQIVVGWISGMVFLSILTTLYGHFVQHRSLG